jgi:hypothetical protein
MEDLIEQAITEALRNLSIAERAVKTAKGDDFLKAVDARIAAQNAHRDAVAAKYATIQTRRRVAADDPETIFHRSEDGPTATH